MTPSRRWAPLRGAATHGVARRSAPATSRGSAPNGSRGSDPSGSRRSTESSGFTASETDFGSPAPGSTPAAPAPAAPGPAAHAALATPTSATALSATSTEDLFRQYMQAYLEDRWNPAPVPAPTLPPADAQEETSDKPLKAKNRDRYYGNSDIECYHFCQQYKEHFDTDGAKGHRRVPFTASFLKNRILYRW